MLILINICTVVFIPLLRACNNSLLHKLTIVVDLYFQDNSAVEPQGCGIL